MTSYVEKIGKHNILNTPPGGNTTVQLWKQLGEIESSSIVLDLACSTGFSGRSIAELSSCSIYGVDINEESLNSAARNHPAGNYFLADAGKLPFASQSFSHILAGCCFGFFQNPIDALAECNRVLDKQGRLLVSPFYYKSTPPESLMRSVSSAIGYRPDTARTLQYWREFFSSFFDFRMEIDIFEDIPQATDIELVATSITTDKRELPCEDRKAFIETRRILAEHRRYQGVKVIILEKI